MEAVTKTAETPRTDALEERLVLSQLSYANRAGDAIAHARELERALQASEVALTELQARLTSSQLQCRDAVERYETAQATIAGLREALIGVRESLR